MKITIVCFSENAYPEKSLALGKQQIKILGMLLGLSLPQLGMGLI